MTGDNPGVFSALGGVAKHGSKQAKWGLSVNPPQAIQAVEDAINQTYTHYPHDERPDLSASDAERLAYDQRQALFRLIAALELQEFDDLATNPEYFETDDGTLGTTHSTK